MRSGRGSDSRVAGSNESLAGEGGHLFPSRYLLALNLLFLIMQIFFTNSKTSPFYVNSLTSYFSRPPATINTCMYPRTHTHPRTHTDAAR